MNISLVSGYRALLLLEAAALVSLWWPIAAISLCRYHCDVCVGSGYNKSAHCSVSHSPYCTVPSRKIAFLSTRPLASVSHTHMYSEKRPATDIITSKRVA